MHQSRHEYNNQDKQPPPPPSICNARRRGPSNKRKERDGFDDLRPSSRNLARPISRPGSPSPTPKPPEPGSKSQLLAGCLAHEFLTKGTLFGQPWDPAQAEAVPLSLSLSAASSESRRLKSSSSIQKPKAEKSSIAEPLTEKYQRYLEVANILKTDGAHLAGIVNPTQLGRFLQL